MWPTVFMGPRAAFTLTSPNTHQLPGAAHASVCDQQITALKLPLSTNNFYKTPKHLPFTSVTNLNKSLAIKKILTHFCRKCFSLSQLCRLCVRWREAVLEERVVSVTGE